MLRSVAFLLLTLLLLLYVRTSQAFLIPSATTKLDRYNKNLCGLRFTVPSFTSSPSSTVSIMQQQQEAFVVAHRHSNKVLEIQLNRPRQLNCLSIQMLRDFTTHIMKAMDDPEIQAVLLTAVEGRAFCAGGDIKEILKARMTEKSPTPEGCDPKTYISVEYKLDSLIHKLSESKPVVSVGDGIVMGGGAGIYQSAGLRVITPGSTFAMPECRIALLPDAGAMYFLLRTSGEIPLYLALTGARLNGNDMRASGLASHLMEPSQIQELLTCLRTKEEVDVKAEIEAKAMHPPPNSAAIEKRRPLIDIIFSKDSVREIYAALESEKAKRASSSEEGDGREGDASLSWINDALAALKLECPVSHIVTLHTIRLAQRAGASWTIDKGLGAEFHANAYLGFRQNFIEGVETAVGLRKGEVPTWTHSSWEEVEKDDAIQGLLERISQETSLSDLIS